jgi:hypothetical protein
MLDPAALTKKIVSNTVIIVVPNVSANDMRNKRISAKVVSDTQVLITMPSVGSHEIEGRIEMMQSTKAFIENSFGTQHGERYDMLYIPQEEHFVELEQHSEHRQKQVLLCFPHDTVLDNRYFSGDLPMGEVRICAGWYKGMAGVLGVVQFWIACKQSKSRMLTPGSTPLNDLNSLFANLPSTSNSSTNGTQQTPMDGVVP